MRAFERTVMSRLVIVSFVLGTTLAGCIPQAHIAPNGVKTSIEKTTVTVKDPQGNVLRVEEKEMVLQEYTAREPVALTTTKPPAVQKLKYEKGKLVEVEP
jgi:hypothetical protein